MGPTLIRVLLVEDNPDDALLVREMLGFSNTVRVEVTVVDRLARALEVLEPGSFDVVLLDLSLPDSSGLVTFYRLHGRAPNVPIVVLTGLDDETVAIEALKSGAQDYLPKRDLTSSLLMRTIRYTIERKKAELALRESESRYRVVLETAPNPMVVYDEQGRVTYFNPAFTRVFGWTLEECQGEELALGLARDEAEGRAPVGRVQAPESFSGLEARRVTKGGQTVQVSISAAAHLDEEGSYRGSVVILEDITRRKEAEEALRHLAYHDSLTNLPNRKSFYERLEDIINQASRAVVPKLRALLFVDLDRFKQVNDTLGHDAGDLLLKEAARRIISCIRSSDHVFRLGGDEFTVLLNHLSYDVDAAIIAEKILAALAVPFQIADRELYVTASIGISVHPSDGQTVEHLVKNADTAMYAAKRQRNCYRFYTEKMNERAQERMRLETDLRRAIARDELVLFFQPILDRQEIVGAEALVRWWHPELGILPPSRFIPLAEETGVIIEMGRWVLEQACRKFQSWRDMGHGLGYVSVNLSARQFLQEDLVESIETALSKSRLDPGCLRLELTESCVIEDPETALEKMKKLHSQGIRFSVDDFGTGYSTLNYLRRFPVDTLKIDKSFVRNICTSKGDREIVKMIIGMARSLGLDLVVEGVETATQLEVLIHDGCRQMQGFLFSQPLPEEEFIGLLARRQAAAGGETL